MKIKRRSYWHIAFVLVCIIACGTGGLAYAIENIQNPINGSVAVVSATPAPAPTLTPMPTVTPTVKPLPATITVPPAPAPSPAPTPTLPPTYTTTPFSDVRISNVVLPTNAKSLAFITYPVTFTLTNDDNLDITVLWEAVSTITGQYDSGIVIVPGWGSVDVTRYYSWESGRRLLTYSVYDERGEVLMDRWSGELVVE